MAARQKHKKAEFQHKAKGGPLTGIYLPHPQQWDAVPDPEQTILLPGGSYKRTGAVAPFTYVWLPSVDD